MKRETEPRRCRRFPAHWLVAGLVATLPLLVRAAGGENWPEFRGPTGQGHSQTSRLPVEWSPANHVAWKKEIPGQGWSSPIFVDGKVYLTTAVSEDGAATLSLRALALDAKTGAILWNTEAISIANHPSIHSKNSEASPTPISEGDRIYVHFGHMGTACLSTEGKVVWRNTDLRYSPVHGNGGSPIIVDDALIFHCDGARDPFIVALDKKTGTVLWKVPRSVKPSKTFSFSTPLMVEVNGQKQVISPASGAVYGYDPKTGQEIWKARYGEGFSVVPRPVYGHGLIFISTGYDWPSIMAVRVDGKGDVTDTHVAWTVKRGASNTPSLLLIGDELYMVSDAGVASCLDAKTGKAHWQERVGGNYSASPLYADGKIYLQNEEGLGIVLKPGKEFVVLGHNSVDERSLASYAVGDGAFFIRTAEHLFRVQQ